MSNWIRGGGNRRNQGGWESERCGHRIKECNCSCQIDYQITDKNYLVAEVIWGVGVMGGGLAVEVIQKECYKEREECQEWGRRKEW